MSRLTDAAQKRLDEYLQQVRACLQGCETVDADEVQRDITEHIETELTGTAEPVSVNQLDDVLRRLGSPSQWVPPEEATWWRKATLKLRRDAGNWPLAYAAFGIFLLFLLLYFVSVQYGFMWPTRFRPFFPWGRFAALILLLASFCVARAALSTADRAKELGARRWLIYPPLLLIYIPLCLIIFLWPALPPVWSRGFLSWAPVSARPLSFYEPVYHMPGQLSYGRTISGIRLAIELALWWAGLSVVLLIWPGLVRIIFRPFADWFNRKWATLLLLIAILLIIVCIGPGRLLTMSRGHYLGQPFGRWL